MKLSKSTSMLFLIVALLILFPILVGAETSNNNSADLKSAQISNYNSVDLKTAEKIVINFLPETGLIDSNINDYQVIFSEFLYGVDDELLGYLFNVYIDEKQTGYVIASADKSRPPIIQFGEGTLTTDITHKTQNSKLYFITAIDLIYADNAGSLNKIIQKQKHNLVKRLNQLAIDIENQNNLPTEEKDKVLFEIEERIKEINDYELQPLPRDINKYKANWDSLENDQGIKIMASSSKELNVVRLYQRMPGVKHPDSACGPTVGAMITNFYKQTYSPLRDSTYYGGHANFINHLWDHMATILGTSLSSYTTEMQKHLNEPYSYNPWRTWSTDGTMYNSYKISINSDRPVAIRFRAFSNGYAAYHFVAGIGYSDTSSGLFAKIKDPDNGANNTGTISISWAANQNYFDLSFSSPY